MMDEWTEFAASAFNARGLSDLHGVAAADEPERSVGGGEIEAALRGRDGRGGRRAIERGLRVRVREPLGEGGRVPQRHPDVADRSRGIAPQAVPVAVPPAGGERGERGIGERGGQREPGAELAPASLGQLAGRASCPAPRERRVAASRPAARREPRSSDPDGGSARSRPAGPGTGGRRRSSRPGREPPARSPIPRRRGRGGAAGARAAPRRRSDSRPPCPPTPPRGGRQRGQVLDRRRPPAPAGRRSWPPSRPPRRRRARASAPSSVGDTAESHRSRSKCWSWRAWVTSWATTAALEQPGQPVGQIERFSGGIVVAGDLLGVQAHDQVLEVGAPGGSSPCGRAATRRPPTAREASDRRARRARTRRRSPCR